MENLVFYDFDDIDTEISTLAVGTVAPRSSDDTLIVVYNDSDTYQANDVVVVLSGTNADQLWLSTDGDRYTISIDIGNIAPNSASVPFRLRRVTPSTQADGACSATLAATPTTWSAPIDTSVSANIGLFDPNAPEINFGNDHAYDAPIPPTY